MVDIMSILVYFKFMRRRPESERLYVLIGRKIEKRRRESNLTQTQLAQRSGLARGSIANIESGNQRVTLHTLWILADELDIDIRSLMPTKEEYSVDDLSTATIQFTDRLKKAAGDSQNRVAVFIASSREEVSHNVDEN